MLDSVKAKPVPTTSQSGAASRNDAQGPGSSQRELPSDSTRPGGHQRSVMASSSIRSPSPSSKPQAAQHIVMMVHQPRRTSSLKVVKPKPPPPTEPVVPPLPLPFPLPSDGSWRTAPSLPSQRATTITTTTDKFHVVKPSKSASDLRGKGKQYK